MHRTVSAYVAAGCAGLLGLAALNIVADKAPNSGFGQLRDYLIRRNG